MEQQISQTSQQTSPGLNWNSDIPVGTPVIYGLHGKCTVTSIETRALAGETQRFYKLERTKSALSRSTREEPAIWLPVQTAKSRGLRSPMTAEDLAAVQEIFASREYYFSMKDAWNIVQNKIDETIRNEGCIGMAKAMSFLFVFKRRQIVASSEANKLSESIQKVFFREIAEITSETVKQIEDKMNRSMKYKLLADQ
jgi:RNA polymerase-interacting CarD/CdnL/TRCF family regulator